MPVPTDTAVFVEPVEILKERAPLPTVIADVEAAVIRPFASTVKTGMAVAEP